jgi:hypothetical protein
MRERLDLHDAAVFLDLKLFLAEAWNGQVPAVERNDVQLDKIAARFDRTLRGRRGAKKTTGHDSSDQPRASREGSGPPLQCSACERLRWGSSSWLCAALG